MSTSPDLQQQILQAEASLNALREQLHQRNNAERTQSIALVKDHIKKFDLTASELGLATGVGKQGYKTQKGSQRVKSGSVKPKFRDPQTGMTWTGRGRTPLWLVTKVSEGKRREDFLIAE